MIILIKVILIQSIALIFLLTGCVDKGTGFDSLYESDVVGTGSDSPLLSINAPPSGSSVRGSEVIVFSSKGIKSPEVSIDGSTWTPASSGTTLISDVPGYDALSETDFILLIQGTGDSGGLLSDSVTVIKDETPPLVLFNNPINGGLVNGQTVLSFYNSDFIFVEASIDDEATWINVISDTTTLADFSQFSGKPESGTFKLYLHGEDAAGNSGTGSIDLVKEPLGASNFNSSVIVYFDTSTSGAGVTTDVYNIPMLVRIDDPDIFAAVRPGAPDIRFFDSNGNQWLNYEIERWDSVKKLAEIWVLVPRVDGDSNSDYITLYYDDVNDDVSDDQNPDGVFSTLNGFAGVWHLKEDPSGVISDSTVNNNDGSSVNMGAANLVDGAVGKGHTFNGSNDWIDITSFDVTTSNVTFSAWIKVSTYNDKDGIIFSRGASVDGLNLQNSGGLYIGYHWNGAGNTFNWTGPGFSDGEWIFAAVTVKPDGGHDIYVGDGSNLINMTNSVTSATDRRILDLKIGQDTNGGRFFDGIIDEARVSTVVRSPEWLKISYENQHPLSTMVSFCDGNDITPPAVTVTSSGTVFGLENITFTDSEPNSPVVSIDNASWIKAESGVTQFRDIPGFNSRADGPFTLYLKDFDACRNTGLATASITKDSYDIAFFESSVDIYFDTSPGGADVADPVDNIPLLVRFGIDESGIIDAVQPGAPDIRFLDSDGVTFLDYEIERWDQVNDVAEVWVLVPEVDGGSTTDYITILYDNTDGITVPDGQNPLGVFSDDNDFVGVWHMSEKDAVDTTVTGNHGTAINNVTDTTGMISGAQDLEKDNNSVITIPDEQHFNFMPHVTVSVWFKVESFSAQWQALLSNGESPAWRLSRNNNSNTMHFAAFFDGNEDAANGSVNVNDTQWHYAVGTIYDGINVKLYVDGILDGTATVTGGTMGQNNHNLQIGGNPQAGGRTFDGILDEVRISRVARSAAWVKLSFENQRDGQTLITFVP